MPLSLSLTNKTTFNIATAPVNEYMVRPDIALKKRIYFRFIKSDDNIREQLDDAIAQDVVQNKKNSIPFVIVASPNTLGLYSVVRDEYEVIDLQDLAQYYAFLKPLTGDYSKVEIKSDNDADVRACIKLTYLLETLADHNHIAEDNLHSLNDFIRRVLFCLFAEDTGIFEKENQFSSAFASLTSKDGSDCERFFEDLFLVLDTKYEDRDKIGRTIAKELLDFPYVNGGLFKEKSFIPHFDTKTRNQLIDCGRLRWKEISPAIFGAMFQNAMNKDKRRNMGAHYTSEENILKLIKPLFLDELYEEFNAIDALPDGKAKTKKFYALQEKIASLKFLDPACGCGNFLIISYRELRRLENMILDRVFDMSFVMLDMALKVNINQFYGIEIEDWPAEIAHLSMWLMEHMMNQETAIKFGRAVPSIPLKNSATIVCANALTTDWNDVIKASDCNYIIGNPPFGGTTFTSAEQKKWLKEVYPPKYKTGLVDFVSGWFVKAGKYMQGNKSIHTALVSTNSICQGEQVNTLWGLLLQNGIYINFAYTSFPWTNDATNAATVTCIIVGFSYEKSKKPKLIHFKDGKLIERQVESISPYLIDEKTNTIVQSQSKAISAPVSMKFGNKPADGGNLILSYEEGEKLKEENHPAEKFLKRFIGSDELINGYHRYCFWLTDDTKDEWSQIPLVMQHVEACRNYREKAVKTGDAYKYRDRPWRFRDLNNPPIALVVPAVSSERRFYVPMDFVSADTIVSNRCFLIPNADFYTLSVVMSRMHMVWMRFTCGRLETRYNYSRDLTYNTFVWPTLDATKIQELSKSATHIMEEVCSTKANLAECYNPGTMTKKLHDAHKLNDEIVEKCYRDKPFVDDEERLSFLLGLYNKRIKELEKLGEIKVKKWEL